MTRWSERAVFVSLVPLALALVALGVRETTRNTERIESPTVRAKELVPPPMLVLAAAMRAADSDLRVDPIASRARIVSSDTDDDAREATARVAGTMRLLADGTIESLELELEFERGSPDLAGLTLHGIVSPSRATQVPGVKTSELACRVDRGAHRGTETVFHVEWMRTPGGAVQMHAVGTLEARGFEPRRTDRVRFRAPSRVLGLDLRFLPAE